MIRRALLSILTLLAAISLQWLDVYHLSFDQPGDDYWRQTLCQLVLAPVVVYAIIGVGNRLLTWAGWHFPHQADQLFSGAFLGICLVILAGSALAASNLLTPFMVMALCVTMIWLAQPIPLALNLAWPAPSQGWIAPVNRLVTLLLTGWIILVMGHLLLICGLPPQLPINDEIGNYLPFYADLLANNGFWPTKWFTHYAFSKGAGLHFFFAALMGIFTVQLANVLLFILSALLLGYVLHRMGGNLLWSLAVILLYLYSPLPRLFFVKNHVGVACFVPLMIYWLAMIYHHGKMSWRVITLLVMTVVATVTFSLPLVVIMVSLAGVGLFYRRLQAGMAILLTTFFTLLAISIWEWQQSGMGNFLLHGIMGLPNSPTPAWDSISTELQRLFNSSEGTIRPERLLNLTDHLASMAKMFIGDIKRYVTWPWVHLLSTLVFLAASLTALRKEGLPPWARPLVIMVMVTVVVAAATLLLFNHAAANRGTYFRIWSTLLLIGVGGNWLLSRWPNRPWIALAMTFLLLFPYETLLQQPLPNKLGSMAKGLLLGNNAYLEAIDRKWPIAEEWRASKWLPGNSRVVHLNFQPGAYFLPGVEYARPLQNSFNADLSKVLFLSPEVALQTLHKHGFHHLFLRPNEPFVLTARSALFSAAGLGQYYRLLWQGKEGVLLTDHADQGTSLPQGWLDSYGIRRANPDGYVSGHWTLYDKGWQLWRSRANPT